MRLRKTILGALIAAFVSPGGGVAAQTIDLVAINGNRIAFDGPKETDTDADATTSLPPDPHCAGGPDRWVLIVNRGIFVYEEDETFRATCAILLHMR